MAAGTKLTTTYPFLTLLLPLAILALITIAAFIHAIDSNFDTLAALWTSCNGPLLFGEPRLHSPLCFAIHFFQSAHATLRGRLEQAIIVSFLAALATITAVESGAGVQHRADHEAWTDKKKDKDEKENQMEEGQRYKEGGLISQKLIENLTIPWLLYSLALGALSWQAIIIPAFLYRPQKKAQPQNLSQLQSWTGETPTEVDADADTDPHSPAVPLSIVLGLFLPATLMLLHPSAPVPIILFLLFPLWVTLIQHLLRPLTSHLTTQSNNKLFVFMPPMIASTLAHIIFLLSLFSSPSIFTPSNDAIATTAALLLLEIDHAAIYLATLYWIYIKSHTNTNSVLATLAATVTLGPGAGMCVGWLYHGAGKAKEPTERERRKSGKATGCFFEL